MRVTSSDMQVASSNPRVKTSNLWVTNSTPQAFTSSNPPVRRLKARVARLKT